jgi:hypothetical protein
MGDISIFALCSIVKRMSTECSVKCMEQGRQKYEREKRINHRRDRIFIVRATKVQ